MGPLLATVFPSVLFQPIHPPRIRFCPVLNSTTSSTFKAHYKGQLAHGERRKQEEKPSSLSYKYEGRG
jgi:hypothetical protein